MQKSCPFALINLILSYLDMLTLEDKVFIFQHWHASHCLATVRRSFRRRDARYHGKILPSWQLIHYVIDNFQRNGTVGDHRKVQKVYKTPYRSIRSLKSAFTDHMNRMRRWDRNHLIDSVMQRWRWCVAAKGERLSKYVNGQALWTFCQIG